MHSFQHARAIVVVHRCLGLIALAAISNFYTPTQVFAQTAQAGHKAKTETSGVQAGQTSSPKTPPMAPETTPSTPTGSGPAQTPAAPAPQQATAKTVPPSSQAASQAPTVQGDYIPCKFTLAELKALVSPEIAPTLTAADEETLKQQVGIAAATQNSDPLLSGNVLNSFLKTLQGDILAGLTPSQALNRVILDLSTTQSRAQDKVTPPDIDELVKELGKSASDQNKLAIESFADFLSGKANVVGVVSYGQLQNAASAAVDEWSKGNPNFASSVPYIKKAIGAAQPINNDSIIDAARASLASLERPLDVGCAMSILSYRETDVAYGFKIAREYIAVQIVVRNLNQDKPFVVHDAEFQVNSDPTGQLGRFFSGRDKVIVRALSAAQSSFDPRALVVHSAEGVGAILSATVPIFNAATLTNAAAVFNGAFVPGLDKYWKDQTADQLNLLNDTGFSSQQSSQTVVPQLGTALFVIFIPSKQFQEGWWTQPCVETTYIGTSASGVVTLPYSAGQSGNSTQPAGSTTNGTSQGAQQIGPNQLRALEACADQTLASKLPRSKRHWWRLGYRPQDNAVQSISIGEADSTGGTAADTGGEATSSSGTTAPTNVPKPKHKEAASTGGDLFRNAYPRQYKDWSGNSLQLFAAFSNTIVAGTHITEDSQLQPSISALNCPTDAKSGNVEFPSPDTGTLSCPLSGKNLDKIDQLRLRNAKDATDPATAEGTVSVTAGQGTVAFHTADLRSLTQPTYKVFAVSQGVEQKPSLTLHLPTDPVISNFSSKSIDFSKAPTTSQTLTINGYHLGSVDSVVLTDKNNPDAPLSIPLTLDALKKDTQLTVPLDPSQLKLASFWNETAATLEVTVTVNKKSITIANAPTLTFTGPTKTAAGSAGAAKPLKKAIKTAHTQ